MLTHIVGVCVNYLHTKKGIPYNVYIHYTGQKWVSNTISKNHITHTNVAYILTTIRQTLDFISSAPGMKLGYIEKYMKTSYKQLQHGCTEKSLLSHNFYLRNQDNPLCIPI